MIQFDIEWLGQQPSILGLDCIIVSFVCLCITVLSNLSCPSQHGINPALFLTLNWVPISLSISLLIWFTLISFTFNWVLLIILLLKWIYHLLSLSFYPVYPPLNLDYNYNGGVSHRSCTFFAAEQRLREAGICCCSSIPPAEHSPSMCSYTLTNYAFHSVRGLPVWPFSFYYSTTWAATHHLQRICLHFWRVDAVMQGACHGWKLSPHSALGTLKISTEYIIFIIYE